MAMQENADNKLSYQGDDATGASIYHMLINGEIIFKVKASKDETGNPIYVMFPDTDPRSLMGWHKTPHRAFLVDDNSRISAMTMKEAVYMNLPWILVSLLYGKTFN